MRLETSDVRELHQGPGLKGAYKIIEAAGRTCYKSENRMTDSSAEKFVESLIANGHGAMLEHGTIYMKLNWWQIGKILKYYFAPYCESRRLLYVTTNYRVIVERKWQKDMRDHMCEPTERHAKRRTFKITCDIGVSREANRHRANSMAERSTRFCNYSKDRFNGEISVIMPDDLNPSLLETSAFTSTMMDLIYETNTPGTLPEDYWYTANLVCERCYMKLLELGWKPQQARRILPLDTATELVHTAFEDDWKHFLDLRCAPNAHPDMVKIAKQIKKKLDYGERAK